MKFDFSLRQKKRIMVAILYAVLYLGSSGLAYVWFFPKDEVWQNPLVRDINSESGFLTGERREIEGVEENTVNLLLLGYGGVGHSGGNLADVLMVVSLNRTRKNIVLISIPRDIWLTLEVQGTKRQEKINTAFATGGERYAKEAVEKVVGMPIDYYAAASFEVFIEVIDELGGVEVVVPVTFNDYYYPVKGLENETCGKTAEEVEQILTTLTGTEIDKQFPCRYEHLHFEKGKQLMDGKTALKFVRSRHAVEHGGDFSRSVRQQALILGMKEKLLNLEAGANLLKVIQSLVMKVKTDADEEIINEVISQSQNIGEYPVVKVNLTTENTLVSATGPAGQYILIPAAGMDNWDKVHNYLKKEIEESKE